MPISLRIILSYLFFTLPLTGNGPVCKAQSTQIEINTSGSAPPVGSLYNCALALREKPYSETSAQECLNNLLKTGYFENGTIRTERTHTDQTRLIFELSSPRLLLSRIDLNLNDPDRSNLEVSLDNASGILRQGEAYTRDAEIETMNQIRRYFSLQQRRIGINSKLNLDFKHRTASVRYSVVEGSPGPAEVDIQLPDPSCPQLVAVLDFTPSDDYVPLALVQRLMKTRLAGCFDRAVLENDVETLQKTGLFSQIAFSTTGNQSRQRVSVRIQGNPLKVNSVNVTCYGQPLADCQGMLDKLPLKAGEIYSHSADSLAKQELEESLRKSHNSFRVFREVTLLKDLKLDVTYSVIVEQRELIINGQIIPDYDTRFHGVFHSGAAGAAEVNP